MKERKSEREREGVCHQKPRAVSEGRTRTVGRNEGERGAKCGPERMAAMQWHMQESECGGEGHEVISRHGSRQTDRRYGRSADGPGGGGGGRLRVCNAG